MPAVDPEKRTQKLPEGAATQRIDDSAFDKLPMPYRDAACAYAEALIHEVGPKLIVRDRYYHKTRENRADQHPYIAFPDDVNPILDRQVEVPLTIFPRTETVRRWSGTAQAKTRGWVTESDVAAYRSRLYGKTVLFSAGVESREPDHIPASPLGYPIPSFVEYVTAFSFNSQFFLPQGKIVCAPVLRTATRPHTDGTESLSIGQPQGAETLAEIMTVPAHAENRRLRWVRVTRPGEDERRFLAHVLCDGNGARRARWLRDLPDDATSLYVRPLTCEQYSPRIQKHSLLLLPTPLDWPKGRDGSTDQWDPHEEWCFDDWFARQDHSCWVLREAPDSKPLRETFVLMPAIQSSELPIFSIYVFVETAPEKLVKELSVLFRTDAKAVLAKPGKLRALRRLHDQLRVSTEW